MAKLDFGLCVDFSTDDIICDLCGKDYTNSDEKGGFVFGSSTGVCPSCADDFEKSAKEYGEEKYIVARPKENESHADFIRRYRKEVESKIVYF